MSPLYMSANIEGELAPWMEFGNYLPQIIPIQMSVYLGCRNGLMTKHLLNGSKVRPTFNQMCRERMAKGMRTYIFVDTRSFCQVFDDCENHYSCELSATAIKKYK